MPNERHKKLYKESIRQYGIHDIRSLHWNSHKTQEIRFRALMKLGNFTGCSVLDLGSGKGDFFRYLEYHDKTPKTYVGVDFVDEFIHFSRKTYPNALWICSDFYDLPNQKFDYIICNGSLNVKTENNLDSLEKFLLKFVPTAKIALGITLLKYAPGYVNNPMIHNYSLPNVRKLLDHLRLSYKIVEGYIDNDFMVMIHK